MCTKFNKLCKACEQIDRNERTNGDRAKSIIEGRAQQRAHDLGLSRYFFLVEMGWNTLIVPLRALLDNPDARCQSCGEPFLNHRDIQIEHIEAPRFRGDEAREHARNLRFLCQSCNVTKQKMGHSVWLDDQNAARISNKQYAGAVEAEVPMIENQLRLW
jgi:5-methylcytosine-specific restriction endonuclease McrA